MSAPTPTATVEFDAEFGYEVVVIWTADEPLDRNNTGAYIFGQKSLAERVAKAINDGVWYSNAEVWTDIHGKTYVSADALTIGKYANSTLRKMGR